VVLHKLKLDQLRDRIKEDEDMAERREIKAVNKGRD
jgi:hypothetical protein